MKTYTYTKNIAGIEKEIVCINPSLDYTNFLFGNYHEGETTVLQPQLEKLGYQVLGWFI